MKNKNKQNVKRKTLTLKYLDTKLNGIKSEVRDLKRVVLKWINETDEEIRILKKIEK